MQKGTESTKKAARAKTQQSEPPLTQAEIELVRFIKHSFEFDGAAKSLNHVFMVAVLESNRDIDKTDKEHLFVVNEIARALQECYTNDIHRKLN